MKSLLLLILTLFAGYTGAGWGSIPESRAFKVGEYGAKKKEVVLFYSPGCPYCQKVIKYLNQEKIVIQMRNTQNDPSAVDYLKQKGGKKQVPCLFINGKAMYESDAIISWLGKHRDAL